MINSPGLFLKTPHKTKDSDTNTVLQYYENLGFQRQKSVPEGILEFCNVDKGQSVDFQKNDKNNGILMQLLREPRRKKNFQGISQGQDFRRKISGQCRTINGVIN